MFSTSSASPTVLYKDMNGAIILAASKIKTCCKRLDINCIILDTTILQHNQYNWM